MNLLQSKIKYSFSGQLQLLIEKAINGTAIDVDFIMQHLTGDSTFAMTRYVDFALSLVEKTEGMERIRFYLFNGLLIQRNYAALYFNRMGDRKCVIQAFELNLIDEIQAFSR